MPRFRIFRLLGLILAVAVCLHAQVAPPVPAPGKYLARFGIKYKGKLIPETLAVPGKPYRLGRFEVTNAQFGEFTRAANYTTDAERDGTCHGFSAEGKWTAVRGLTWRGFAGAGREDYPVVCVSPDDAQAYLDWLSALTKELYRLPTEAEWQYAACTGQDHRYPWGEAWNRKRANSLSYWLDRDLDQKSWSFALFEELAYPLVRERGGTLLTRVDLFRPNDWGFQDIVGNAWEITLTESGEKKIAVRGSPQGFTASGGSWHNNLELVSCQGRDDLDDAKYRDDGVGFRVLLEPGTR